MSDDHEIHLMELMVSMGVGFAVIGIVVMLVIAKTLGEEPAHIALAGFVFFVLLIVGEIIASDVDLTNAGFVFFISYMFTLGPGMILSNLIDL